MTALPDWDIASDAELAQAAVTGDRVAFAEIYDRYADRLFDFCVGMVRDREAAADCVQDTFCTAATRLSALRDSSKLRPWLYAIARNEALRRIRERRREQLSDELPEVASSEPGPDALAARTELAALINQAATGLSDRDREVLDLAYRHGLDGPELAEALGMTAAGTRTLMHRLRETVERSLGALLIARRARTGKGCPELTAALADWDGEFSILLRKRIARHIDTCPMCLEDRREMVNPVALLGGMPLFIPVPAWLRKQTLDRVQLTCSATSIKAVAAAEPAVADPPPPSGESASLGARVRHSRMLMPAALAAGVVTAALGLTLAWPSHQQAPRTPDAVTGAVPQPYPGSSAVPAAPPLAGNRPASSPGKVAVPANFPSQEACGAVGGAGNCNGTPPAQPPVGGPAVVLAPAVVPAAPGPAVPVSPNSVQPASDSGAAAPPSTAVASTGIAQSPDPGTVKPSQSETFGSSTTLGDTTDTSTTSGGLSTKSDGSSTSGGLSTKSDGSSTSGGLSAKPGGSSANSDGSSTKPSGSSTTSGGSSTKSGGSSTKSGGSSTSSGGSSNSSGGKQ